MQRCTDFTKITTCEGGRQEAAVRVRVPLRQPHKGPEPQKGPTGHLVKLQHIQEIEELAVLLAVLELDVVLLQSVQRELGLIIYKHLHGLCRKGQVGLTSGHLARRNLLVEGLHAAMIPGGPAAPQ